MDTNLKQLLEDQFGSGADQDVRAGRSKKWRAEETMPGHEFGRKNMRLWMDKIGENIYLADKDFQHTARFYLGDAYAGVHDELADYGARVPTALEPAVAENDARFNNPAVEHYNGIGERDDKIVHHPSYARSGNIVYKTNIVSPLPRWEDCARA